MVPVGCIFSKGVGGSRGYESNDVAMCDDMFWFGDVAGVLRCDTAVLCVDTQRMFEQL